MRTVLPILPLTLVTLVAACTKNNGMTGAQSLESNEVKAHEIVIATVHDSAGNYLCQAFAISSNEVLGEHRTVFLTASACQGVDGPVPAKIRLAEKSKTTGKVIAVKEFPIAEFRVQGNTLPDLSDMEPGANSAVNDDPLKPQKEELEKLYQQEYTEAATTTLGKKLQPTDLCSQRLALITVTDSGVQLLPQFEDFRLPLYEDTHPAAAASQVRKHLAETGEAPFVFTVKGGIGAGDVRESAVGLVESNRWGTEITLQPLDEKPARAKLIGAPVLGPYRDIPTNPLVLKGIVVDVKSDANKVPQLYEMATVAQCWPQIQKALAPAANNVKPNEGPNSGSSNGDVPSSPKGPTPKTL